MEVEEIHDILAIVNTSLFMVTYIKIILQILFFDLC